MPFPVHLDVHERAALALGGGQEPHPRLIAFTEAQLEHVAVVVGCGQALVEQAGHVLMASRQLVGTERAGGRRPVLCLRSHASRIPMIRTWHSHLRERARDRGPRPPQELRAGRGRPGPLVLRGPWRGLRPARPQRRGQDDHRRDPGGLPRALRRRRRGAGPRPRGTRPRPAAAGRRGAAELWLSPPADPARGRGPRRPRLPQAARPARDDLAGGPGGQGRRAHQAALRRPAAAAGPGDGAGRRPRADLPGRAHHRVRPGGPAGGLERRPRPQGHGQDRGADHALPGRGADAGRPGGHRQGGPDRGRGPALGPGARLLGLPRLLPGRGLARGGPDRRPHRPAAPPDR